MTVIIILASVMAFGFLISLAAERLDRSADRPSSDGEPPSDLSDHSKI